MKGQMSLVNLCELIKYHPYHISTFAGFADVTQELLEAALVGEEVLDAVEVRNIAKYSGVPFSVLVCPSLIKLSRNRYKHRKMIWQLHRQLYTIWNAEKEGSKEASRYMRYNRIDLVNLILDFQNKGEASYCRYLGVKEEIEQCFLFIANENRKPRGRQRKTISAAGGSIS